MEGLISDIFEWLCIQAHEIVNREEPPRGHAPKGAFYSADRLGYDFFETDAEEAREKSIIDSMPFLHALIYENIELANTVWMKRRQERRKDKDVVHIGPIYDETLDSNETEARSIPNNFAKSMEGVSHSENMSSTSMETHRLKHVSS